MESSTTSVKGKSQLSDDNDIKTKKCKLHCRMKLNFTEIDHAGRKMVVIEKPLQIPFTMGDTRGFNDVLTIFHTIGVN